MTGDKPLPFKTIAMACEGRAIEVDDLRELTGYWTYCLVREEHARAMVEALERIEGYREFVQTSNIAATVLRLIRGEK